MLFLTLIGPQEQGRTHRVSVEERREQLYRNTPDLRSSEGGSTSLDRREHADGGLGIQPPSETAPERALGDGQDDGDADESIGSGKSRGNSCVLVARRFILITTSQGERLG